MSNSQLHLTFGTLVGVGLAVVLSFFGFDPKLLFLGAILSIIGGEFPDLDHHKSLPRKLMKGVLPGVIGVIALYLYFSWKFWSSPWWEQSLFVVIPFLFLISYEKFIPRHRGALHKIPGLVLFIGAIFLLILFVGFNLTNFLVLAGFGVVGFFTHIVLDSLL